MGHEWIVDVLTDLRSYAQKNGLVAIAAEAEHALNVARKELTEKTKSELAKKPSGSNL